MFDNHPIVVPLAILDIRIIIWNGHEVSQLLIQWRGLLPKDASWEDQDNFDSSYPEFQLKGKFSSQGGETIIANTSTRIRNNLDRLKSLYQNNSLYNYF